MSNQERVARAVRDAFFPYHVTLVSDTHRAAAAAAIDALADVDGIAGVLRAKAAADDAKADEIVTQEEFDAMIDEIFSVSYQHDDRIVRIEGTPEAIAAAVVAWMKDRQ